MQSGCKLLDATNCPAIYSTFRLDGFVPLDRCQLRRYNATISSNRCKHPGHPEACLYTTKENTGSSRTSKRVRTGHLGTEEDDKQEATIARSKSRQYSSANLSQIQAVSRKNAVDPFDAFCIPMDSQLLAVLQFIRDVLIQSNYRAELLVTGQDVQQHRRYDVAQRRVRDSMVGSKRELYPLLAAAAARISASSRYYTPVEKQAPYYLHQAIQGLRAELKDIKSDSHVPLSTLASIHNVSCSAWFIGDLKTVQTHLQLIKTLLACNLEIQNSGNKFPRDFEELQRHIDVQVAAETDSHPLWEGTDCQNSPLLQERLYRIHLELSQRAIYVPDTNLETQVHKSAARKLRLGNPFDHLSFQSCQREDFRNSLAWTRLAMFPLLWSFEQHYTSASETDLLSLRFQEIISSDFEPWRYMMLWCIGVHHGSVEDGLWIGNMGTAICHKLLSLPRPSDSSSRWQDYLEDAFRLALLIILVQLDGGSPWRVPSTIVTRFRNAVAKTESAACLGSNVPASRIVHDLYERFSSIEARLLLWMLQVGLAFTGSEEEYDWFGARIRLLREASRAASVPLQS